MFFLTDRFGSLPDCDYDTYGQAKASARVRAKRQKRCIKIWDVAQNGVANFIEKVGKRYDTRTGDV